MSNQQRVGLQILLGIVIVVLAYWLYVSITGPYAEQRREERRTARLRQRMELTRTALTRQRDLTGRFPNTLDSLLLFVNQTESVQAELDSTARVSNFVPDSLLQSPLTGNRFEYDTSPDSVRVDIYRLRDPDTDAQIGALEQDITRVNVANWEN